MYRHTKPEDLFFALEEQKRNIAQKESEKQLRGCFPGILLVLFIMFSFYGVFWVLEQIGKLFS